jgi:alkylation response protein AidB-like acyl-CoA dehydrogenase
MQFALTPEQQQLDKDVREYLKRTMPPGLEDEWETNFEGDGPINRQYLRQLGADGWLGIGWPKEYGGQNRSPIDQYIFYDIAYGYHGIRVPMMALNSIAPVIMRVGTPEQKKRFLPPILNGEIYIALGYTEPEAGSDLASLKTTAVRDGDDYIINGQKVFTSLAEFSDYIWLAARTNREVPKHKGISIFMIDKRTPGVTVLPLLTMANKTTSTFYDNVRVPKECLIGEENKGWQYIHQALAGERVAFVPHSAPLRILDDIKQWIKEHRSHISDGAYCVIKNNLAEMAIEAEIVRLFNFRVAWLLSKGRMSDAESSMTKVFSIEHILRLLHSTLDIMGLYGQLQPGSKYVPFKGRLENLLRVNIHLLFGGGANDVLRDVVAMSKGLGSSR